MLFILLYYNDDRSSGLYLLIMGGITLIGAGIWGQRVIRCRRLFAELATKYKLSAFDHETFTLTGPTPALAGKVEGVDVEIYIHKNNRYEGRWKFGKVIKVTALKPTRFEFVLQRRKTAKDILGPIGIEYIVTGDDLFDEEFKIQTGDHKDALRLFNYELTADLMNNKEVFDYADLIFDGRTLRFSESGMIITQNQMDRAEEIMLFMIHIVRKIDALN